MLSPETIDTRELLADYLRQRFPGLAGAPIDESRLLLEGGLIDSLGILDLAAFLTERLGIDIADDDFEPSNFETFGKLIAFVERKRS
ncbi:acyl carrier protein [Pseudorhodoplanes sinuspersici]|uniref:Uncharacterized protein n=1 Tax=Pseudorhodoplanes sinuspersici TaxID=1235591 RepID=A0A1W6ZZV2_9HYPH|nr:acyl carrier protein [Pseudorhodoplanes sinuspersici]ARQ02907.1 hypothetical protein CAK95_11875 [Pseudorhodoplanes sinuspersici]RKE70693.1 acyl carrier protein [Pseudorhodoplanes sinuspersici]